MGKRRSGEHAYDPTQNVIAGFSGIYEIRNTVNGKRYVGSAANLTKRRRQHFSALESGKHSNRILQSAWGKYGSGAFTFAVILICEKVELLAYEQRCFDVALPEYNIAPVAGSQLGFRHSAESKLRMSESHNRVWTDEQRQKVALALRGRTHSSERRAKASAAMTGRKLSPEHRAKISALQKGKPSPLRGRKRTTEAIARTAAALTGRVLSEEHKAKLRAKWRVEIILCAGCGREFYRRRRHQSFCSLRCFLSSSRNREQNRAGRIVSLETRAKIGAKHKGKTISAEVRAKMSAAKIGRKFSVEHRMAMSRSVRARGPEYHANLSRSKLGNKNSLGRKQSLEVRAKISAASIAMWAARRSAIEKP